jgi:hypothetical protein
MTYLQNVCVPRQTSCFDFASAGEEKETNKNQKT